METLRKIFTERLVLRQWADDDYAEFAEMNTDSDVMQYYPNKLNTEQSNALADKFRSLIASNGWGFWAIEIRQTQQFIGFVGLHRPQYELPVTDCVEIGWRISRQHWGKGYATEAGNAALNIAFDQLKLPEIYSFTTVHNYRSRQVMERLGLSNLNQNFNHPMLAGCDDLQEHVLYKITAREFSILN